MVNYNKIKNDNEYEMFWKEFHNKVKNIPFRKEIFMPSMDELYKMQDMGVDLYKYLLVKASEALIIDGVNHPYKGIFKNAYMYLRENPDIARIVCSLYPLESYYSDIVKYDYKVCEKLIFNEEDKSLYNLDNLAFFNDNTLGNYHLEKGVIDKLADGIDVNPKYRFEYRKSPLVDDIFMRRFDYSDFYRYSKDDAWKKLMRIEPAYVFTDDVDIHEMNTDIGIDNLFNSAFYNYINRYGLSSFESQYNGKDILTNQDENVKRLFKCINTRR